MADKEPAPEGRTRKSLTGSGQRQTDKAVAPRAAPNPPKPPKPKSQGS